MDYDRANERDREPDEVEKDEPKNDHDDKDNDEDDKNKNHDGDATNNDPCPLSTTTTTIPQEGCARTNDLGKRQRKRRLTDTVLNGDWDAALDRIARCPGEASEWSEVELVRGSGDGGRVPFLVV